MADRRDYHPFRQVGVGDTLLHAILGSQARSEPLAQVRSGAEFRLVRDRAGVPKFFR